MIVKSISITGTGAVVALAAFGIEAKMVILEAPSTNGADVLIGGSEVSSSVGFPIVKGTVLTLPPNGGDNTAYYELYGINAYIGNNDVLKVLYGG